MADRFWVNSGSGNWNANANWSTTSGGAGGASFPVAGDNAIFDSAVAGTCTFTVDAQCDDLTLNGWTGTLIQTSGKDLNVAGSLDCGTTPAWTYTFNGGGGYLNLNATTTGHTIRTGGIDFVTTWIGYTVTGGSWTLLDAFTSTGLVGVWSGTFNTGGFNFTSLAWFDVSATAKTLNLSSSLLTFNGVGSGAGWIIAANATVNAGTSTIQITDASSTAKAFRGRGATYNNLIIASDNVTIENNNTFNVLSNNTAGLTNGLKITSGSTQTVTNFVGNGISGSTSKLAAVTAASAATISCASGIVQVDYMSIQDITVSGGATFLATNSTDVSGNTGWTFLTPCYFRPNTKFWGI